MSSAARVEHPDRGAFASLGAAVACTEGRA